MAEVGRQATEAVEARAPEGRDGWEIAGWILGAVFVGELMGGWILEGVGKWLHK